MKLVFLTIGLTVAFGLAVNGCTTRAASGELELSADGSTPDHQKIAAYYRHEAAKLRQMFEDLSIRITVYERLFGPTSDWVSGTRLLAQSYEHAAQEYERKAREHLKLMHELQLPAGARSEAR